MSALIKPWDLMAEVRAQGARWPLWTPVLFGLGAASYFGLKWEPDVRALVAAATLACALAVYVVAWGRSQVAAAAAVLLAFAAVGFAAPAVKSALVAAPRIPAGLGVATLEGWVVDVSSPSSARGRLLIRPTFISHLAPERWPARVRIVVSPDAVVSPGERVRLTALLDPPPRPAAPEGYDFARDAWFQGLGGVGLALRQPVPMEPLAAPWPLRVEMALNGARWRLSRRLARDIAAVAPGAGPDAAGLAAAVSTSQEAWLSPEAEDALRGSGLAHMLAIAGLHTAALSGFVFAALRLGVAAWPWLAVRVSGKKVAALGGLLAVLAYLALSGAHAPAKRAAVTASVAFVAILLDRRAISLRSLSVAALIVLILQPEAVIQPGFQMSFAATGALVALAEAWPRRSGRLQGAPLALRWLQHGRDAVVGLAVVSVVAGAATAPFAIQHFNRMANYGVPANLTADFVASAVMMPAVGLSLVGEAVGAPRAVLAPVLTVAGWAARAVVEIGRLCSGAPGASVTAASAPSIALPIAFAGLLFAILWRGRLRWLGVPLAFAVLLWPRPAPPLAWIAGDGNDAAIRVGREAVALKPGKRAYAVGLWSSRRGLTLPQDADAATAALFDCDRKSCTPTAVDYRPAPVRLAAWFSPHGPSAEELQALCTTAAVVVVRSALPPPTPGALAACRGRVVLGAEDFTAGGAAEVWGGSHGLRLRWSEPVRGVRPWTGSAPDDS